MTPLRALVCDDEAPLCDLMARRVEKLGLQVDKAQDGKAGLTLIGANSYDLIVTDIYMPEVTGLELLEAAKARDRDIQVIIVTATATVENAIEAINLGAFCYLTKPFDHLSVFDNAVMRAQELRRLTLNDRRGASQPGNGSQPEPGKHSQPSNGESQELKDLKDLMASLPFGLVVVGEGGRISLSTPLAKSWLEQEVRTGRRAIQRFLESAPGQEGEVEEEVRLGQRTLHLSAAHPPNGGDPRRKVVILQEKRNGTSEPKADLVEAATSLREGLLQLARMDLGEAPLGIIRAMALEVADLERQAGIRSPLGKVASATSSKAKATTRAPVEKPKSPQGEPSVKPAPAKPPEAIREEPVKAAPAPEPAKPYVPEPPEPAQPLEPEEPLPALPMTTGMLQRGAAMFGKGVASAGDPSKAKAKPNGDFDEVERQAREAVEGFIARVAQEEGFETGELETDDLDTEADEGEEPDNQEEMSARLGAVTARTREPWASAPPSRGASAR
jgi:CheY-like chemotaxis protein